MMQAEGLRSVDAVNSHVPHKYLVLGTRRYGKACEKRRDPGQNNRVFKIIRGLGT